MIFVLFCNLYTTYEKWIFFPSREFTLLIIMAIPSSKNILTGIFVLTFIHFSHCLLGHGHAKLEQSWTEVSS